MSATDPIRTLLAGDVERELRLRVDPDDDTEIAVELVRVQWDDDAEDDIVTLIASVSSSDPAAALRTLCAGMEVDA